MLAVLLFIQDEIFEPPPTQRTKLDNTIYSGIVFLFQSLSWMIFGEYPMTTEMYECKAVLVVQPGPNGQPIMQLALRATDPNTMKFLAEMAWGKRNDGLGLHYCKRNTVCLHSVGGMSGHDGYELAMTINTDPWTGQVLPPTQSQ